MGLHLFAASDLDVLILEVGMGGRLDSTNIINRPTVCAVTLLDMDHTEFLGDTIEKIAAEKAGIMKPTVPVLIASGQEPRALEVLLLKATTCGIVARIVPEYDFGMNLLGFPKYQRANVGLAIEICRSCLDQFEDSKVQTGIESCQWPGRAQIVHRNPSLTYYLDGAHTLKSMEAAIEWFNSVTAGKLNQRNVLLFNCMYSRNPLDFIKALSAVSFDQIVFSVGVSTKPTKVVQLQAHEIISEIPDDSCDSSWQETLSKLWMHLNPNASPPLVFDQNFEKGLQSIDKTSSEQSLHTNVFVVGSLLLVGDVLKYFETQDS